VDKIAYNALPEIDTNNEQMSGNSKILKHHFIPAINLYYSNNFYVNNLSNEFLVTHHIIR